jgi:LAS superfamily LD-carboxypeptidase LdcB
MEIDELFGLTDVHLAPIPDSALRIHHLALNAFVEMRNAALLDRIQISPASAYRSFDQQLAIWNAKATGRRDCLDDNGNCIDIKSLTDLDAVKAIMRFSALPGASRHHWGTDLDIYDAAAVADDYPLQLVESEYRGSGPFAKLDHWLAQHAANFGFRRPYAEDRGGIAAEAWHISYEPLAREYELALNLDLLEEKLRPVELELKSAVLNNLQYLFERYIQIT